MVAKISEFVRQALEKIKPEGATVISEGDEPVFLPCPLCRHVIRMDPYAVTLPDVPGFPAKDGEAHVLCGGCLTPLKLDRATKGNPRPISFDDLPPPARDFFLDMRSKITRVREWELRHLPTKGKPS
jgi:hypothetical protein